MRQRIIFALICICVNTLLINAQTSVEPPISNDWKNPKAHILTDKTLPDGNRIVYCNSISLTFDKINGKKDGYKAKLDPFVIKKGDNVYYGLALFYVNVSPVQIPDSAQVLLKASNNNIIKTVALYGCDKESHTSSTTAYNPITMQTIVRPATHSNVFAHFILNETDYQLLANSGLIKIRIETSNGQNDFDVSNKKLCAYLQACYPIMKEAINSKTTDFDSDF